MNSTFRAIENIELTEILKKLWIWFSKSGGTLNLKEWYRATDWWKAKLTEWIFKDFAGKGRAEWDRVEFVQQYLWCNKHQALTWYEENFNINNDFKPMKKDSNPIKDKWDSLSSLSPEQIQYLKDREIDYSLLDGIIKSNSNGNIAMPIRALDWRIKSIQSRSIKEAGSRYYVEANTDSDWIFYHNINYDKKSIVIVEWFTDFLSLRQYTTNVVGLLNAKNEWQIQMIKQMSLEFRVFFIPDNDDAWQTTIDKFNELGIKFNIFRLENYGVKDVNELLTTFHTGKEILDMINKDSERPMSNLQQAMLQAKEYKKMYEENDWHLGFTTWYELLDKYVDWFIKGKVYLLMAFSNLWKTRFAYSLIQSLVKQKKKTHFYSLEVDKWMLFIELIWALYGIDKKEVMEKLEDLDITELEEYIEIHDSIRTLDWIEQNINNEKPDIAIIDFVQNIEMSGSEYEKMTDIALRLQKLAILSGVTLIPLSQVGNESRFADWKMVMPKWSWALFASSDVIFTLWAREWQKYFTISKNKYWPAWKDFVLEVDYAKSKFNMAEEIFETTSSSCSIRKY